MPSLSTKNGESQLATLGAGAGGAASFGVGLVPGARGRARPTPRTMPRGRLFGELESSSVAATMGAATGVSSRLSVVSRVAVNSAVAALKPSAVARSRWIAPSTRRTLEVGLEGNGSSSRKSLASPGITLNSMVAVVGAGGASVVRTTGAVDTLCASPDGAAFEPRQRKNPAPPSSSGTATHQSLELLLPLLLSVSPILV